MATYRADTPRRPTVPGPNPCIVTPPFLFGNKLLAALDPAVLARLRPKLHRMALAKGAVLYRTNEPIGSVYFPASGIVSMVVDLVDGMRAEVGVIGQEGMVGTSLTTGIASSFAETFVQVEGQAWRMSADDFQQEFRTNPSFQTVVLRYREFLTCQIMQTAACNGRHDIQQRLIRWLLTAHDAIEGDVLPLTQDLLAMMLGVHRPSVTVIAMILQESRLIQYRSGHITILDRFGLEAKACECYQVVKRRYAAIEDSDPLQCR